ncbi:hypothetical protein BDF20DRAFT_584843 [Mycotypha africana]|uniref:uncharacterized protein n=1 Tax=Mycotypha africana TaxID=64632 RepID=UPI002300708F|nr:uncharacterized protein BDF20DRAFT_584843 [Mycotypha africana]KAI8975064.1 hypothetical protein BDF20DRAFT_584843 [Mycotypha africana]
MFRNMVRSDGFTVDFLFSRKKKTKEDMIIHNHTLTLEDFSYDKVQDNYRPAFLDPGRRSVFTAAIGLDRNKHQVRSCSTKEYYHMTRSTRYAAKNMLAIGVSIWKSTGRPAKFSRKPKSPASTT